MMKIRESILILLLVISPSAWANIEMFDYEVIEFVSIEPGSFKIKLRKQSAENEIYTVNLRFRPECYSRMDYKTSVSEERAIFNDAIREAKDQIKKSSVITFGHKSGTGFLPIPGKPGEYVSESLRLLEINGNRIPYFQHHDLGWGLCKNA